MSENDANDSQANVTPIVTPREDNDRSSPETTNSCELGSIEGKLALEARINELEIKLWEQTEANAELKRTRDALTEEIMDLTQALFEEANGMVAEEAKARAILEIDRRKLEAELMITKEQLKLETQQLHELKSRFGAIHPGLPFAEIRSNATRETMAGCCSRQSSSTGFDKADLAAALIHDYSYFPSLLPKHRFESRYRYDGPTSAVWDEISEKVARHDLAEFSRFVERGSNLDSISILAHPYVKKICETDVGPCLQFEFKPKAFVRRAALAMLRNTCCIENLPKINAPLIMGEYQRSQGNSLEPSNPPSPRTEAPTGSVSVTVCGAGGGGSDSPKKGPLSPKSDTNKVEGAGTIDSSTRFRGIMNQFASSVTSLPETLLSNLGNHTSSSPLSSPEQRKGVAKFCALCGVSALADPQVLEYRLRLNDAESWMYIDGRCRERLVAAGHFFTFLRHLRHGLYSNRPLLDLFYDLLHYRRCMFYARMAAGATMFFIQSDLEIFLDQIASHMQTASLSKSVPEAAFENVVDEIAKSAEPVTQLARPAEPVPVDPQCSNNSDDDPDGLLDDLTLDEDTSTSDDESDPDSQIDDDTLDIVKS